MHAPWPVLPAQIQTHMRKFIVPQKYSMRIVRNFNVMRTTSSWLPSSPPVLCLQKEGREWLGVGGRGSDSSCLSKIADVKEVREQCVEEGLERERWSEWDSWRKGSEGIVMWNETWEALVWCLPSRKVYCPPLSDQHYSTSNCQLRSPPYFQENIINVA